MSLRGLQAYAGLEPLLQEPITQFVDGVLLQGLRTHVISGTSSLSSTLVPQGVAEGVAYIFRNLLPLQHPSATGCR
jgi:hypothetical protein